MPTCCPEPGKIAGSMVSRADKRPSATLSIQAAPEGPLSYQHYLYTASALAVDGSHGRWRRPGIRGDSLHGLVHTSPYAALHRLPTGSVPGTVATPGVMCHTPAAALRGPAAKKEPLW